MSTFKVSACWRALSEHQYFCRLTTPEKLQMINHRPRQPVAVHLVSEQGCRSLYLDHVDEVRRVAYCTADLSQTAVVELQV